MTLASHACSCGRPILGRQRLHCSRACASKKWPSRIGVCSGCGNKTRGQAEKCRYCARPKKLKPCAGCGKDFWPWEPTQSGKQASHPKTQCPDCRSPDQRRARARMAREEVMAAAWARDGRRQCPWCLDMFTPGAERNGMPRKQIYCSTQHLNIHKSKRRKARLRGARLGEPVSVWALFARDGGLCGLCGQSVDRTVKWPHPSSPSVDHVLPLSVGGSDSSDNLQLAHLGCNLKKSDGGARRMAGAREGEGRLRFFRASFRSAGGDGARGLQRPAAFLSYHRGGGAGR
jgi:hypothetical protein